MRQHEVRSAADALSYLTDCTLATVLGLKSKKFSGKYETERQIRIAQTGVDWMRQFNVPVAGTRAQEVVELFNGNVADWAHAESRTP